MYERKDAYYRKAKREGYRSRAAYKLSQIAAKEKAVRPGDRVIDARTAPERVEPGDPGTRRPRGQGRGGGPAPRRSSAISTATAARSS